MLTGAPGSNVDVPIYFTPSPDQNGSVIGFNAVLPTHVTMVDFTVGPAALDAGLGANIGPAGGGVILAFFGFSLTGPGLLGHCACISIAGYRAPRCRSPWLEPACPILRAAYISSDPHAGPGWAITITGSAAINQAPAVSAGLDQTIALPAVATLQGSASDDGLNQPSNNLEQVERSRNGTLSGRQPVGDHRGLFCGRNLRITTIRL